MNTWACKKVLRLRNALFAAALLMIRSSFAADNVSPRESIIQDSSGVITLAASNAVTHGTQLRYEPATNKNCLGYWTKVEDWADWQFKVTQPGTFEVELWQGCGQGQGGSEVAVEVAGERIDFVVEETGHFQIFLPRRIGQVRFSTAGTYSLAMKPQRKKAAAIMDIRQVRLLPVKAKAKPAPQNRGPLDEEGRPLIRKLGTIDLDLVETTPIVFSNRLYRFEWVREGYWNNQRKTNHFRFIDHENGDTLPPFADGHEFGSAFVHDGTMYVTGTYGRDAVNVFAS